MTDAARYKQLIDAALVYRDAWCARKAFGKQFPQKPTIGQVFLKVTAAQLDKDVDDSRRNLERAAIRLKNDMSEQKQRRSSKKIKSRRETNNDEDKCADCKCGNAGDDCGAAAVLGIIARNGK